VLVALHSLGVGVALLIFTDWSVALGGWDRTVPRFFARQAGVFHLIVACGYLLEYLRYRGIGLLVLAKSTAVVFLLSIAILGSNVPWVVPFSEVGDGLIAVAVLLAHRHATAGR
jgi:putative Ca2+/H+ antiporter (TMEM165/GDT1 family)